MDHPQDSQRSRNLVTHFTKEMFSPREIKIEDNDNESAIAPGNISYDYDVFKSEISTSPGQENGYSSPTQQMSTSKLSSLYIVYGLLAYLACFSISYIIES